MTLHRIRMCRCGHEETAHEAGPCSICARNLLDERRCLRFRVRSGRDVAKELPDGIDPHPMGGLTPAQERALTALENAVRLVRHAFTAGSATVLPQILNGHTPARAVSRTATSSRRTSSSSSGRGSGERKILTAIAQHPKGVTREQLTVLTGYKRSSRTTYLQRLRSAGLIEQDGDRLIATPAGRAELGPDFEKLPTGRALLAHHLETLPGGERLVLDAVARQYPEPITHHTLRAITGYQRSSLGTYLQRLRARQLVSTDRGAVRASEELFDG